MRSKNILSIAAFVAAFGLSAAFASLFISKPADSYAYQPTGYCKFQRSSRTADAISKLIAADYANGYNRAVKIYDIGENFPPSPDSVTFADYARTTQVYVDKSSNLAVENLPRDFQAAWQDHLTAWRNYSNFLNQSADISSRDSFTAEEFSDADAFFGSEIDRTYERALKIGRGYGANVR